MMDDQTSELIRRFGNKKEREDLIHRSGVPYKKAYGNEAQDYFKSPEYIESKKLMNNIRKEIYKMHKAGVTNTESYDVKQNIISNKGKPTRYEYKERDWLLAS